LQHHYNFLNRGFAGSYFSIFKNEKMKYTSYVVGFLALLMTSLAAGAQVYETAADTVKLNKEFTEVSNDIANLTAQLTVAHNNRPGYQTKADAAASNARDAAQNSSVQADIATKGGIKEARKAKRHAKKAFHKAKDARSANHDVGNQDDKIASLKGTLAKKQQRLQQLTTMREAIKAQLPQQ
jgi:hypothetical protein